MLESIEKTLADQSLLTTFQVRVAFAQYVDRLKADFKSIAASGWGPELIPDQDILQSQFPEVLEDLVKAQGRLAELQVLFAAASEEDFEDADKTDVLPADEVKAKKAQLKEANAEWKAQLKLVKNLATNMFVELQAAGLLPKGEKKGTYCNEGLAQKDAQFGNGLRILNLAQKVGHKSEYAAPLTDAMEQGELALNQAQALDKALAAHKLLEDEVKELKTSIKQTEGKRDELVESARAKISTDEARQVIVERLRKTLMDTFAAYLRTDQRACVRALENLWSKYAVTAKSIEDDRDKASAKLQKFLVELGYE